MCGISGIINFHYLPDSKNTEKMLNSIVHRGPNQKKIYNNKFCSVGFVRLSIIDLSSNSNQPFINYNNKIKIFFNGEIYNFEKLKKENFSNSQFKSKGDGEVILYLYEKFGISFINKLKGMFAIIIIDEAKKKTYLIRDRFGIKPLYYSLDKKKKELSFSSEIQSFHISNLLDKKINYLQIFKYLNYSMVNANNETCFESIFQVPPGKYLEFSKNGLREFQYYSLEKNINEELDLDKTKKFKFYSENIKEKFYTSFLEHSKFDVKAGIHLSGGADSAILAILSNELNKQMSCFTFGFDENKYSELDEAKKISKILKLNHFSSNLQAIEIPDFFNEVLEIEYEPFSSMRILSQHYLYKKFKDKIKVVFDGSGGDEIGAGYNYYIMAWYLDLINSNKKIKLDNRLNSIIKHAKNETMTKQKFIEGSLATLKTPGQTTVDGSFFDKSGLISSDFLKKFENTQENLKKPFKSNLRNAQYVDLFQLKLPRCLKYIDRASMRNSIEARVPLLDHELVEACLQTPSEYKILNNQQRIITKYPFKKKINKEFLFKNKKTIADPQSHWIFGKLFDYVRDTFSSSNFASSNIINQKEVILHLDKLKKIDGHKNSFFIFQLLSVELWIKGVVNRSYK